MVIKQNALSFILISFFVISCDALTFEPDTNNTSPVTSNSIISITYPNSGTYYNDNNITINWSSSGDISNVRIQLYEDGIYEYNITSNTSNDGSYTWNPSSSVDNGCCYKIRVSDYSNSNIYDETESLYFYD